MTSTDSVSKRRRIDNDNSLSSTFGEQSSNVFYAGPTSGSGNASFRAITTSDLPNTVLTTTGSQNITNKNIESSCYLTDNSDVTKRLNINMFSSSTGTTTVLYCQSSTNRSQTLQDVSDTFVYQNSSDALTNKTIEFKNNISGYTASILNSYMVSSYQTEFGWGSAHTSAITINFILIGSLVILVIPAIDITSSQNNSVNTTSAMPSFLWPANLLSFPILCNVSGTASNEYVLNVQTDGDIQIQTSALGNINGTSFATNGISINYIYNV